MNIHITLSIISAIILISNVVSDDEYSQIGVNTDGTTEQILPEPTQQPTHHGIKIRNSYNEILDYYWVRSFCKIFLVFPFRYFTIKLYNPSHSESQINCKQT